MGGMLMQGQITITNWQQFVPTLLIVLTTFIYIPLMLSDIVQQVCVAAPETGFQQAGFASPQRCCTVILLQQALPLTRS
jgi:hypothetical protein